MVTVKQAYEALDEMDRRAQEEGVLFTTSYYLLKEFISQVDTKERLGLAALLRDPERRE